MLLTLFKALQKDLLQEEKQQDNEHKLDMQQLLLELQEEAEAE